MREGVLLMSHLTKKIVQLAEELESDIIDTSAYLHEHPELSSEEFETVKYLKERIAKLGLEIEDVPNSTGFTALLDTGKAGKIVGVRTDIDALPIDEKEDNLAGKRKYISKNPGVMHACGHDGHMAIVLTTMEILLSLKEELSGKIYFIFEEGEEIGSGIVAMVEHLQDKKIEAIYGNHLAAFLATGKVSVDAGPKMAGAAAVDMYVHGKGGHGSRPDLSINPVFAGANILTGLTSAWANRIDVTKTVTLGITQFNAGSALNVIPETAFIGGSLRFYDEEEGKKAVGIVKEIAEITAKAHQCTISYGPKANFLGKPVINDEKLAQIAGKGIEEILPGANIEGVQWFASESFSRYAEVCPTLFGFIGIQDEAYGSGAEHHNEYFDVDDKALKNGVLVTTKFVVDFLLE